MKNVQEYIDRANLPEACLTSLISEFCKPDFSDIIAMDIIPDPQAGSVITFRIKTKRVEFAARIGGGIRQFFTEVSTDLLWDGHELREVVYSCWPPTRGNYETR
jgi:hypothetical protein